MMRVQIRTISPSQSDTLVIRGKFVGNGSVGVAI